MGKKTLEEIGKILLVSIISILITTLTARRVLLDSKVDKTQYENDNKKRDANNSMYRIEHEKRHDREEKQYQENLQWIKWYLENTREKK